MFILVIKRFFSCKGKNPPLSSNHIQRPKPKITTLSNGTEVPHYVALDANEILSGDHPRILNDFAKGTLALEKQYCSLELPRFLAFVQQTYKVTPEMLETIRSPLPEASTVDQVSELMDQWFNIFNTWFFAGTLTKTKIIVGNFEGVEECAFYMSDKDTIVMLPDGFKLCEHAYPGTQAQFHVGGLLHEMAHAFVSQASCQGECCREYVHPSLGGEGILGGHGPCFLDSFLLVSAFFKRVVSWHVEGVEASVIDSMYLDVWQPSLQQLKDWDVDTDLFGDPEIWFFLEERQDLIIESRKLRNRVGDGGTIELVPKA
ncbi:hypothetical protein HYALB_00003504 [Hymenoscyphus albidus]|uniref:Uncharacterized protein n=1 Tax=Hymenoscyphus albidus TaxID=595503 RepID=A0A9N9LNC7_9HELO|nr:hypothetical protein HYALB_00003504 [Hymenoscyphus albidus]